MDRNLYLKGEYGEVQWYGGPKGDDKGILVDLSDQEFGAGIWKFQEIGIVEKTIFVIFVDVLPDYMEVGKC